MDLVDISKGYEEVDKGLNPFAPMIPKGPITETQAILAANPRGVGVGYSKPLSRGVKVGLGLGALAAAPFAIKGGRMYAKNAAKQAKAARRKKTLQYAAAGGAAGVALPVYMKSRSG